MALDVGLTWRAFEILCVKNGLDAKNFIYWHVLCTLDEYDRTVSKGKCINKCVKDERNI